MKRTTQTYEFSVYGRKVATVTVASPIELCTHAATIAQMYSLDDEAQEAEALTSKLVRMR